MWPIRFHLPRLLAPCSLIGSLRQPGRSSTLTADFTLSLAKFLRSISLIQLQPLNFTYQVELAAPTLIVEISDYSLHTTGQDQSFGSSVVMTFVIVCGEFLLVYSVSAFGMLIKQLENARFHNGHNGQNGNHERNSYQRRTSHQ